MKKSPQELVSAAGAASSSLEAHCSPELGRRVSPLISWAAFHLGATSAAEAIISGLASPAGWADLRRALNADSYDVVEAQAFVIASSSVTTAVDLCSAALYRLAGGTPPVGREFDLGEWRRRGGRHRNHVPPALLRWLEEMLSSSDQSLLENARHQSIHRTTARNIKLTVGTERLPATEFIVNGEAYPVDELVPRLASHGERSFDAFCEAIRAEFH